MDPFDFISGGNLTIFGTAFGRRETNPDDMIRKLLCASILFSSLMIRSQQNFDFEALASGSYSSIAGWTLGAVSYTGNNAFCSAYAFTSTLGVEIVTTPYNLGAGTPSVVPPSPFGGTQILKLNSANAPSLGAAQVYQTYSVTANNCILQYAFFANLQSGDHAPVCCNNPYYEMEVRDCSNNQIPVTYLSIMPTTTNCANTGTLGMVTSTAVGIYTPVWIIKTYNLSSYIGSCVTIYAEAGQCNVGGHAPAIFLDAKTAATLIQPNGGTFSGNNYVVCNNNSATLSSLPANSYTWSGPGGFNSNNQSIVTTTAGVYTLSVGNNGGGSPTQTINLVFANTPTVTASANVPTICPGASAVLTATGNGINTYSWSNGANTQSISVSPTVSTIYTVTANSGTCPATATVAVNVTTCTSIYKNQNDPSAIRVWPNPNKGNFTVRSDKEETIFIYDQLGRILKELRLNHQNNYSAEISGFSEGIYFITNRVTTKRIVVIE